MEKSICIFGDSIVWGSSDWEGGGWAHKVQQYCNNLDDAKWQRVFVLGIPGDRTAGLLKRFVVESKARNPTTIIVAIGINDTYSEKLNGPVEVPIEEFERDINQLASLAKAQVENVIFVGLLHVDESKTMPRLTRPVYCANKTIDEFNSIIKEVCDKNDLHFLSIDDLLSTDELDDGLHPNTAGHEKIFQSVREFLIRSKIL